MLLVKVGALVVNDSHLTTLTFTRHATSHVGEEVQLVEQLVGVCILLVPALVSDVSKLG